MRGEPHIESHYQRHVLAPHEAFDTQDPKFPYMTVDEYLDAGEELSLEHAEPMDSSANVVGCVIYDPQKDQYRNLKFRKQSKFKPGYSDVVIYDTDFDDFAQSFMLVKPSRLEKYKKQYFCDLGNYNN